MNANTAPCQAQARCAAPGCTTPLARRHRRGRPPRYCSPTCQRRANRPHVEVDHEPTDTRPAGRVWLVRLHRGGRSVIIARELGRPSADYLAQQITDVLTPRHQRGGGATHTQPRSPRQ